MQAARRGVIIVSMTRMVRLLIAAIALGVLTVAPAHATGDPDPRYHRLASRDVCVVSGPLVKGWHLSKAIEAWNETGLVAMTLRASCVGYPTRIVVRQFRDPGGPRDGEVRWPASYVTQGRWSDAAPAVWQWLYPAAVVRLNAATLEAAWDARRCFGWHIAVHELGHALGIWHGGGSADAMSEVFDYRKHCWTLSAGDVAALAALGY